MSARSHQPIGGRLRSAVEPGQVHDAMGPVCRNRVRAARRRFGHAHDLHHLGTACTRTMCAPPSTAAVTAAAVPQSRSTGGRSSERLAHERLARRPDQHRPAERRAQAPRAAPAHHSCAPARLANPIPGSTTMRSSGTPAAVATAMLSRSSPATSVDDVVVVRRARTCPRTSARVHQDQRGAAVGTTRASAGS